MSSTEWETPQDFFDAMDQEFRFTLDPCATLNNTKCPIFFATDGLTKDWSKDIVWMNPPYTRDISKWIKKAYDSAQQGGTVICLIQGRSTDTKWWHKFVMKSSEIRFIKGRLHFGLNGVFKRANISNVIVVFRPFCSGPPTVQSIDTR